MVKRYDCTDGGAQFCQGCYTMEEESDRVDGNWVRAEDYDALALVVYDECARQGCFCPTDPATGECSFCRLSLALDGFEPNRQVGRTCPPESGLEQRDGLRGKTANSQANRSSERG